MVNVVKTQKDCKLRKIADFSVMKSTEIRSCDPCRQEFWNFLHELLFLYVSPPLVIMLNLSDK